MAEIEILWANIAIRQRNKIFEYWNERNGSTLYSKKLNAKIKEGLQNVRSNPKIGKTSILEHFRMISLGHYSIIYKITQNTVYVMAFWDNRQDPKKLLIHLKNSR
jgi:plasmid stabilization system protein ParE